MSYTRLQEISCRNADQIVIVNLCDMKKDFFTFFQSYGNLFTI